MTACRAERTPRFLATATASATTAVLLLVFLLLPAPAASLSPPPASERLVGASVTLRMGTAIHGKLDVYLELPGPESARAWPNLKQAVYDYRDRIEFVFHIGPLPNTPIALAVAKAAFYIDAGGSDVEETAFFDQVFLNQALIMDGAGDNDGGDGINDPVAAFRTVTAVANEGSLDDWAVPAANSFSIFDFVTSIEDDLEEGEGPTVDAMLAHSLSSTATTPLYRGLRVAPAIYMGDALMLYLKDVHHDDDGTHPTADGGAGETEGGSGGKGFNPALWEFLDDFLLWKANSLLVAEAPMLHDASYWHY